MPKHPHTYTRLMLGFGLATVLFALLPILRFDDVSYRGYTLIFGRTLIDISPFGLDTIAAARLPFSGAALGAFVLPLLGGLIILVHRQLAMVSLACFLVGLFLQWSLTEQVQIAYTLFGTERTMHVDWIRMGGLYGAMLMTLFGGITSMLLAMKS
ncbi:MAG: hypothetical protein EA374_03720 [Acholeplasmatales bacterium]|nr:MAG: hypothetical protein EA374_03720 [Acholeplasmatales bacterium]